MAYASRSGRAKTNPSSPEAFGVCYRCSRWFQRRALRDQWDWRGNGLANLYLLVCNDCYDRPQPQLRALVLPADPTPVIRPSVEPFFDDET
jgi:hypothetical protein